MSEPVSRWEPKKRETAQMPLPAALQRSGASPRPPAAAQFTGPAGLRRGGEPPLRSESRENSVKGGVTRLAAAVGGSARGEPWLG